MAITTGQCCAWGLRAVALAAATGSVATLEAQQATSGSLEEIVVTAQRRAENLDRAAIAVSVVTGNELTNRGVTQISDLTQLVPALRADSGAGPYNALGIRGVATVALNAFADPAIAVNIDGVYLPRPWSAQALFFDVERVEVLKGPQGTLYGRNATAGAINVVSRQPDATELTGNIAAEVGNFARHNVSGAINVPVADKAAFRAAFQVVNRDGYFSDGTSDEDQKAVRLSFKANPSDRVSIAVRADYAEQGGKGNGATAYCIDGLPVGATNPNTPGRNCPTTGQFYGDPWTGITAQAAAIYPAVLPVWRNNDAIPDAFVPSIPLYSAPYQDNHFSTISGQFDFGLGKPGTLSILPAVRHEAIDFLSVGGAVIRETNVTDQNTLEARFTSADSGRVRYILGAFALDDKHTGSAFYDAQALFTPPSVGLLPPAPNLQAQHTDNDGSSHALFGNATFSVTDRLRISLGARSTYDHKSTASNDGAIPYYVPVDGAVAPTGPAVIAANGYLLAPPVGGQPIFFTTSGSRSWRKNDWKLGVEWDAGNNTLLYSNVGTGFKSGGFYFSPLPGIDNFSYRPENLRAFTLGAKNRLLGGKLQLNIELFDWDYRDQQVAALALIPPFIIFPQQNAEKATIKGAEVELRYAVTDKTLLTVDVQHTSAEYDKFTMISAFPQAQCVTISAGPPFRLDCSGNRLLNTPDTTAHIGIRHTFPLAKGGSLALEANSRYESARLAGYNAYAQIDAHTRTDLRFGYQSRGDWRVEAFVDNVEDVVVPVGIGPSINQIPGLYSASLRPPRIYGVRMSMGF